MLHIVDDLHARDIPDLPSLLPWAQGIDDGVIMTRRSAFMASYLVVGPDFMSTDPREFEAISEQRLHPLLIQFADQRTWVIHSNIVRLPTRAYPTNNHFSSRILQLIDSQRQLLFEEEGQHYSTRNIITLMYAPFSYMSDRNIDDFYFEGDNERLASRALQRFYDGLNAFEQAFSDVGVVRKLGVKPFHGFNLGPNQFTYNVDEQLQFLYHCMNGVHQPIIVPDSQDNLSDYLMGEPPIVTDDGVLIGDRYCSVISVRGFPKATIAPFFARFAAAAPSMRLSTKSILLDKETSLQIAREKKSAQFANLFSLPELIKTSLTKEESRGRADVRELTDDADDWIDAIQRDELRLALMNTSLILFDKDPKQLRSDTRALIEDLRSDLGIIAYVEPPAVDATKRLVGSLPGDFGAGLGLPALSTQNVADMLPISAIWSGIEEHPSPDYPPHSPPSFIGRSTGATSFSFCTHPNGPNSTMCVCGPPRGGKTTLMNLLVASHDRYPDAIASIMDYNGGFEVLGRALESEGLGRYLILAPDGEGSIAFAPFSQIHVESEFMYAIQFVRLLVTLAGKTFTKQMREHTRVALETIRDAPDGDRSLFAFYGNIQDQDIKSVLELYIGKSKMTALFGARTEDFDDRPYLFFEMQKIDEMGDPQYVIPVYYHVLHIIMRRAIHKKPYLTVFDEIWRAFVNVNPNVRELLLDFLIRLVRTIEKMNGTPILCLHSPEDIESSDDAKTKAFGALLMRAIVTWVFLPIPRTVTDDQLQAYTDLGLSKRELTLLRHHMQRARDYYYMSSEGRRPFELELSDLAKAFVISESRDDEKRLLVRKFSEQQREWITRYLEEIGLGDYVDAYRDTRPGPTRRAS